MERRQILAYLLCFVTGCITAVALIAGLALIRMRSSRSWPLHATRSFGDITIGAKRVPTLNGEVGHGISKQIWLSRNGIPFLSVHHDRDGKVVHLAIIDEKERVLFTMAPAPEPGKWARAMYGGYDDTDKMAGEVFFDINFDGHFDTKYLVDSGGEKASWIYVDQSWMQVDHCDTKRATSAGATYIFDPSAGWHNKQ